MINLFRFFVFETFYHGLFPVMINITLRVMFSSGDKTKLRFSSKKERNI